VDLVKLLSDWLMYAIDSVNAKSPSMGLKNIWIYVIKRYEMRLH